MVEAAVSKLVRLLAATETRALPDDLADWLARGVRGVLDDGATMDEALGLKARQGRWSEKPQHAYRLSECDRSIRALGLIADPADGASWNAAEQIATWISAYPLQNNLQRSTPGHIPESVAGFLDTLLQHDPNPPRSVGHIYRILTGRA